MELGVMVTGAPAGAAYEMGAGETVRPGLAVTPTVPTVQNAITTVPDAGVTPRTFTWKVSR